SRHALASASSACHEIDGPSSQHESSGLPHRRQAWPRSTPLGHIAGPRPVPAAELIRAFRPVTARLVAAPAGQPLRLGQRAFQGAQVVRAGVMAAPGVPGGDPASLRVGGDYPAAVTPAPGGRTGACSALPLAPLPYLLAAASLRPALRAARVGNDGRLMHVLVQLA